MRSNFQYTTTILYSLYNFNLLHAEKFLINRVLFESNFSPPQNPH